MSASGPSGPLVVKCLRVNPGFIGHIFRDHYFKFGYLRLSSHWMTAIDNAFKSIGNMLCGQREANLACLSSCRQSNKPSKSAWY